MQTFEEAKCKYIYGANGGQNRLTFETYEDTLDVRRCKIAFNYFS